MRTADTAHVGRSGSHRPMKQADHHPSVLLQQEPYRTRSHATSRPLYISNGPSGGQIMLIVIMLALWPFGRYCNIRYAG